MTRLAVRSEAEADVAEACEWYEAQSPELAEEFLPAVEDGLTAARDPAALPIREQGA